ncbi:hypothetical protein T09_6854 [Trichinella sp. T9]|nr:hypothetical protein T09_6854 [Trichinella sp. T9]
MNLTYFSKCHPHSNQCEDHQSRNTIKSPIVKRCELMDFSFAD